ncbi:MAG TPA: hypothetical protein VEV65_11190 [Kineosporiaceae bacterium]|nr:hypothetical protein [Kineosporiaceae bacterium]
MRTLPGNPDLRRVRAEAKDLRRGVHRGVPDDVARLRQFEGWHALVQNVGTARVEERDMHRWFGVKFNNSSTTRPGTSSTPASVRSPRRPTATSCSPAPTPPRGTARGWDGGERRSRRTPHLADGARRR